MNPRVYRAFSPLCFAGCGSNFFRATGPDFKIFCVSLQRNFIREDKLNRLKHIINAAVWTLAGLYFALVVLLHIPAIKGFVGREAGRALEEKLGTKVSVGKVDLGFLNRLVIDDVVVCDRQGRQLLTSSRVSVKVDVFSLFEGRVAISSAQLFGASVNAYRPTASAEPNYQFVLDSLASKDKRAGGGLDLSIGSLIVRNGRLKYNRLDAAAKGARQLDLNHLNVSDISAHVILNALTDDSVNIVIKKLAFKEASGPELRSLSARFTANKRRAVLAYLNVKMPGTSICIKDGTADYSFEDGRLQLPSLRYRATLDRSVVRPSDVSFLLPELKSFKRKIDVSASLGGTSSSVRVYSLQVNGRSIYLSAKGSVSNWQDKMRWAADINSLSMRGDGIKFISENLGKRVNIPLEVTRLGNLKFKGSAGGYGKDVAMTGVLRTDAGNARLSVGLNGKRFNGRIETEGIALGKIIADNRLGTMAAKLSVNGYVQEQLLEVKAQGTVRHIDYNRYTYRNIDLDAVIRKRNRQLSFNGKFGIDDANGKLQINGSFSNMGRVPEANITARISHFNPQALKLTSLYPSTSFGMEVAANIRGKDLNTANGTITIKDFEMQAPHSSYRMDNLQLEAVQSGAQHTVTLQSDFARLQLLGHCNYAALPNSIINIVAGSLPTLPGLPRVKHVGGNNFVLHANISKSDWLQKLFGIDIHLERPVSLSAAVNDHRRQMSLTAQLPAFTYAGNRFEHGYVKIISPSDTLKANVHVRRLSEDGQGMYWNIQAKAADNKLNSVLTWKNLKGKNISGSLHTETDFFNIQGKAAAHVNVHTSKVLVDGTTWVVQPGDIVYHAKHLTIDHFAVTHGNQHVIIAGLATPNPKDSVVAELKNVDIAYILNLVNFHAVEFSGKASGKAYIASAFNKPSASARLQIDDFRFEDGRMGTLYADSRWNEKEGQIDIDAIAKDTVLNRMGERYVPLETSIQGYVSPRKNNIELNIKANGTRIEFLKSFCGSFIDRVDAFADGNVQVAGPLDKINLTGELIANGSLHLSALNTSYTLKHAKVRAIPNEIRFLNDTIYDRDGHQGILSGALYHQHLTKMSYDINVDARNLLSYDTHAFGDNTFYGTAYATGKCNIRGKSGEVVIDVNATAERGSQIVYNVASPASVSKQEFIHWSDRDDLHVQASPSQEQKTEDAVHDIPTDIHINFLMNVSPEATLKLLMDPASGDYIALNGSGGLRATYYNKGNFDLYGNYLIDHGIYKLTIQNAIKKDFQFMPGGTISFGGDPYAAALNLKAQYTVQGVSLSDLNIGRSFSNSNIRVNCLMNITGTPASPKVDFSLDMPTLNNDAKQMVLSLINSEEEMNQQVLYLLAIGRFYTQGSNNAATETGQSQTSLAMQSLLSGTVSQQINNVLSSVVNNTNWNFGANISTGDEGWNNAEYEGILSGRLLDNRLLFNGQFGYRDNANATTSFIGDFDLRYLLFPNGNFAVRMYNQTNDRYFTRNSLNTQGIGLILKKDFNSFSDLFRRSKKAVQTKPDEVK